MQLDFFRKVEAKKEVKDIKLCVACKEVKSLDNFRVLVKRHGDRHTLSSTCSSCDDKAELIKKEYRKHNPLPEKYKCPLCNMSHDDYLERGIYKTQSPFSVDHCQDRMVARGWICNPCNSAMGLAKHDISILKRMINYLKKESNGTREED
jgi:hypothetical protein